MWEEERQEGGKRGVYEGREGRKRRGGGRMEVREERGEQGGG